MEHAETVVSSENRNDCNIASFAARHFSQVITLKFARISRLLQAAFTSAACAYCQAEF